jgi:dienelactone hydrolase
MYRWEWALTTCDQNRVVRPLEWGFEWISDYLQEHQFDYALGTGTGGDPAASGYDHAAEERMAEINRHIVAHSESYFDYTTPTDFRLEERPPLLYPTNVRPETLKKDAELKHRAANGRLAPAQYLRFTSPESTPYPENNLVNARWYPAKKEKQQGKPKQAMIVMPQWNADGLSHNALCDIFNWFGISCLRLSKPYHDIRRPQELERADYACSANIGRTLSACRQAVVDIRSCVDWLEQQGYEQFGVLGTSLGSCYAFVASAHDKRLRVNAFNHASTAFGDVVWAGQSTRHIREALENAGLTQERLRNLWAAISPMNYYDKFAAHPKKVLAVYAQYDLTFPLQYSLEVVDAFKRYGLDYEARVLPCGHYTTGEFPYKYIDAWYLSSFVHRAFRDIASEPKAVKQTVQQEQLAEK